jgi:hypothetical protein
MFNTLFVLGVTLVGQVGGANERYPGGVTGPPPATNTTPSGAPTLTPLTNPASPPANGATRNTTPAPSSGPYAPSRPSNFNSQPTTPAINPNSAPPNMGKPQPPPGYPRQNSFPANDSASGQQPPSKSALMMQAMLTPPRDSQLRGESVRLIDVVSSGPTRNEQTQRIEAYWDLCSSVADYYLSVREQEELRNLTSAASRQSAALQEAEKKMAVRSDTSLRAARASQFRLAGFIGRGPNNLPLPADIPHCGTYTSRYEQVFAGRSSPEAQVLAQLLPMRYVELDDAAVGVSGAEDFLRGVISRNENPEAAGNLRALELLALQRRAFVQIARDYNRRIARYSELATPGQISPDRLTGMLIKRPSSSTAPPPTRQSSGIEASPQRTFANTPNTDDWLPAEKPATTGATKIDSSVQPASATQSGSKQERSVLVQPQ